MRNALWVGLGVSLALGLGLAASAAAEEELNDGLYLELQGGGSFFQDSDLRVSSGGVTVFDGKARFDPGWTAGGAIGVRLFHLLRLEAHGSWHMADFDQVKGSGATIDVNDAFAGAGIFLGNVYLDIPFPFPIHPYVGGGAGVGIFSADVNGSSVNVDSNDATFAWNLMGGVFVPVWRHLELDLRYRYLTADDPKVDGSLFGLDGKIEAQFETHELVGALRVVF